MTNWQASAAAQILGMSAAAGAAAQDLITRTEISRSDVAGAPGTELLILHVKQMPGAHTSRITRNGDEYVYVISGATFENDDGSPGEWATGSITHYGRDEPHGEKTITDDAPVELLVIDLIDKTE